jgi:trehalose 6-phosphate synthase/phosphatase
MRLVNVSNRYQVMKAKVDELVGNINGRFGTLDWTPVVYQYRSFPQEDLVPLYQASEVVLVTPLRDGMNLVAKEYVASRADGDGVLVLSEMAGAAGELGEALIVNPYDVAGLADALRVALTAPEAERRTAMAAMRDRVRRYDVARWAGDFLGALREDHPGLDRQSLTPEARTTLVRDFRSAGRRLLLLDYDGTLVPLRRTPAAAVPDERLGSLLARLATAADVAVVSSRPRATLEEWFGQLPVALVAEHGAWVRPAGRAWEQTGPLPTGWKPKVRELMESFVGRLPGSFVEEKEATVAWHFRNSDPDLAQLRARELTEHLIGLTESSECRVVEGSKVIEVRPAGVGKGEGARRFLAGGYDFVLAIGDDTTDEDLFRALPERAYSVRVGPARTSARYNVATQAAARCLVEELVG